MEDAEGGPLHDRIEIRIAEDDVCALAAEFELHLLQIAARRLHDLASYRRRSCERNLADPRVLCNVLTRDMSEPWYHVDHARRETDLGHQLGDRETRKRRKFGRLHDDAVAGR